jgi:ribosomal protein S18 acetylase RimI-like enzyme
MEYRPAESRAYESIRPFPAGLGWERRVQDPSRFRTLLEHSERTVVAWDVDRVVGFARALCDGVSNGYLSMVAVAPDRRRQGIGRDLVRRLMRNDPGITLVLRAAQEDAGFWEKLGFRPSVIAMERTRIEGEAPPDPER